MKSGSRQSPAGQKMNAIPLPGLTLDTLGLYFAALGLLRLLSRRWPQVRGCWRNGVFTVIAGPEVEEALARDFSPPWTVNVRPPPLNWSSKMTNRFKQFLPEGVAPSRPRHIRVKPITIVANIPPAKNFPMF